MMILSTNKGISRYFEVCDISLADNYEIKMLKENSLDHITSVDIREVDGDKSLMVKVDGMMTLSGRYSRRAPDINDIKSLMRDIRKCLVEMKNYLLSPGSLVINFKYILFDVEKELYRFIYVPGHTMSFRDQMKELFEEIMVIFDHKDREGVSYLYDLYSYFLRENFTPELFCKIVKADEKCEVKKNSSGRETFYREESILVGDKSGVEEELIREIDIPEIDDSKEESLAINKSMYMLASVATVVVAVVLYIVFGIPSLKFSAVLFVSLSIYILVDVMHFKEKKETEEIDRIMAKQMEREIPDDNPIVINEPKDEELDVDTSVLAMNRENETVSKLVPLSDDGGEVILLIEGDTRIGRKKSLCDYCIDDSSVSRVHAIISKNDKVVRVRDAGSTNGTFINDRRIEVDEVLEANIGDLISIAGLQYECC